MGDGDWTCPDASCANVNFARRQECNRCGKPKEKEKPKSKKLGVEIGKEAAEKSKGLFSADDWMCTKCGNVNWARRSSCNVCNAPRFGEVEERTGYGGGYNERGNVEYNERLESDDEFDEFGRRKKKFRKATEEMSATTSRKLRQRGIGRAPVPVRALRPGPGRASDRAARAARAPPATADDDGDDDDDGDLSSSFF